MATSEKNSFTEEEKNLIETFIMAFMCTEVVDRLPPKSEDSEDFQAALIILKNLIEDGNVKSAEKILQEVCDRLAFLEVIEELFKK